MNVLYFDRTLVDWSTQFASILKEIQEDSAHITSGTTVETGSPGSSGTRNRSCISNTPYMHVQSSSHAGTLNSKSTGLPLLRTPVSEHFSDHVPYSVFYGIPNASVRCMLVGKGNPSGRMMIVQFTRSFEYRKKLAALVKQIPIG